MFYTNLDIFHIPYEALKNTIYKHTLPDIIVNHICFGEQQKIQDLVRNFTLRQTFIKSDMSTEEPSIEERLREIIIKQFGEGEKTVTLETFFVNDLEADSLDVVELVMELEDEFDVSISDEDAKKMQTVGDAVKYINEHTHNNGA